MTLFGEILGMDNWGVLPNVSGFREIYSLVMMDSFKGRAWANSGWAGRKLG